MEFLVSPQGTVAGVNPLCGDYGTDGGDEGCTCNGGACYFYCGVLNCLPYTACSARCVGYCKNVTISPNGI